MNGLTALVTGGGSGIGFATAKLLLESGANVMIVGRDKAKLKRAQESLSQFGDRLKTSSGDVSSEGYANKLVGDTVKAFGGMNILINNAGVFRSAPIIEMAEEDFDYTVDINLKGTWFMCKFAVRPLINAGGGAIVNVSSMLARQAYPGVASSAYSAAKGGVVSLTKALAIELAPEKIRVNVVLPALVDTPILDSLVNGDKQQVIEKSKRHYPMGRIGEPDDVARAICFLADPRNSWVTGSELVLDGGVSCS
jgi:NAD(P)-dependent dehydrogenase (short-subunit alcohol dehydrogenase family)